MEIPSELRAELVVMRRNPDDFTVLRRSRLQVMSRCRFCGKKTAIDLGHPNNPAGAGIWCSIHGWLSFDSVKIRPVGEEYIPKSRKRGLSHGR